MTSEKPTSVASSFGFGGLVTAASGVIVILTQEYFPPGDAANLIIMTINPLLSGALGYLLFGLFNRFNFRTVAEMQEDRNFDRDLAVMQKTLGRISDPAKKSEAQAEIDEFCLARMRTKKTSQSKNN